MVFLVVLHDLCVCLYFVGCLCCWIRARLVAFFWGSSIGLLRFLEWLLSGCVVATWACGWCTGCAWLGCGAWVVCVCVCVSVSGSLCHCVSVSLCHCVSVSLCLPCLCVCMWVCVLGCLRVGVWASFVVSWFYLLLFLLLLALRSVGWVCMLLVRFGLSLVALEMGAT